MSSAMLSWCCRAWTRQSLSQDEWGPFSLRFIDHQQEVGFLKSTRPFLFRRVQAVGVVAFVMSIVSILVGIIWVQPWDRTKYSSDLGLEVNMTTFYVGPACVIILGAFLSVVRCAKLTDRAGSAVVEVAAILTLVTVMVVVVLGMPANVASLRGAEVSDVVAYSSDSAILLCIDGIVTAAHLGLPIRWFMMLPLQVMSVLLYATVIAIGGSEPEPQLNVVFLTGLVIVSSLGKRHAELADRQAFLKIIQEKKLRCQAEFQLARASNGEDAVLRPWASPACPGGAEVESSVPTSKSGAIFGSFDENLTVPAKLARIAEVGREEHWLITSRSIQFLPGKVLGRGGFGIVIKAIMSGIIVAVKISNKELHDVESSMFEEVCNEMRVFRHLRHPNIVNFHGAIIDPLGRKIALVLECVKGVLLESFILEGQREDEVVMPASTTERFQVLLGTCSALLHMHSIKPCIVHSDLKSRNVMVELFGSEVRPKLLDFGLARVAVRGARLRGGTLPWMAPEALTMQGPAAPSVDVYSFGHMLNFVSTGMLPPRLTRQQRRAGRPPRPLPRPQGCRLEPVCGPLADECLNFDPGDRPIMAEVCQRLLALPQRVQLPGASPTFLENLCTLSEGLERAHNAANASQDSLSNPRAAGETNSDSEGPEGSSPQRGSCLPALPEDSERVPTPMSQESAQGPERDPGQAAGSVAAAPLDAPPPPPPPAPWKPCPNLPSTKDHAMLTTLVELASTWNIEQKRSPCCELHASAKVIQHLCSQLREIDCNSGPLPRPGRHCPECGLLATENAAACDFCGGQMQAAESSALVDFIDSVAGADESRTTAADGKVAL